jgi:phosphatidylglycerophosphate synthase
MNISKENSNIQKWNETKFKRTLIGYNIHSLIIKIFENIIPNFLTSKMLTNISLLLSLIVLYFRNINVIIVCIIIQRIADTLDGQMGRKRNEGFIKWGYFCDHFYDIVFLVCIFIALHLKYKNIYFVYIAIICCLFFTAFSLKNSVTKGNYEPFMKILPNIFPRNYIAVEELTIVTILRLLILKYKKKNILNKLNIITYGLLFLLFIYFVRTQNKLSNIDIENKKRNIIV